MSIGAYVSIIAALITVSGVIYTAYKTSNTTLAKTNYENAESLYKQYKSLNDDLKKDVQNEKENNDKNTKRLEGEISSLREEMKDMVSRFKEREVFLEREIEIRDDRIDELVIENTTLKVENAELKRMLI